MDNDKKKNIARFYDVFSAEYAAMYFHELDSKPVDRHLLDEFSALVSNRGIVCDAGCGPGEIAVYLRSRGCSVVGVDISGEMIGAAKRLTPDIQFEVGDMTRLRFSDNCLAGITAFYAIVHCTYDDALEIFREFHRILQPAGRLLLSFHIGEEVMNVEKGSAEKAEIDFHFLDPVLICKKLDEAGFTIDGVTEREPYPDVEYQSRRAYIRASKRKSNDGR